MELGDFDAPALPRLTIRNGIGRIGTKLGLEPTRSRSIAICKLDPRARHAQLAGARRLSAQSRHTLLRRNSSPTP